jgi:hypothetical protein
VYVIEGGVLLAALLCFWLEVALAVAACSLSKHATVQAPWCVVTLGAICAEFLSCSCAQLVSLFLLSHGLRAVAFF